MKISSILNCVEIQRSRLPVSSLKIRFFGLYLAKSSNHQSLRISLGNFIWGAHEMAKILPGERIQRILSIYNFYFAFIFEKCTPSVPHSSEFIPSSFNFDNWP